MHYAGMWPVQDRDLVNCTTKEKGDDVCYIATQACNYPYPQPDKVTRATCYIGGWILKKIDAQNTYVIYISDVDLAGSIPGMIKNKLAEKQAGLASRVEKALKAWMIRSNTMSLLFILPLHWLDWFRLTHINWK